MKKLILVAALFVSGSGPSITYEATPVNSQVRDFGNGVFYFPYHGQDFGREFSAWRSGHKNWIIITIASDDTDYNGYTRGYYVIANPDM